ncbi:hypothetical protein [Kitasatospora sp. MMS16-BH015]|uniref:hypothetical protein n=1 Tax=Kitasatospora sp. MMS16-BH015 TaxID=2018025 RepID=UPI000CF23EBF|nr:hypothetical protein [Kitasatospora sp. MMS16-BH015]
MDISEAVVLESRTLRGTMTGRVEVLDKVKALVLLPDGLHVTGQMVADYYEVGLEAIKSLVKDHREELENSGYRVVAGQELRSFKDLSSFDPRTPTLAVFPRRAVLNVGMLLRDSEVAREVRRWLLDRAEPPGMSQELERLRAEQQQLKVEQQRLWEAHAALARQAELDREVIGALSVRIADMSCEVRTLGGRVDMLCSLASAPGPGRRRFTGRSRR